MKKILSLVLALCMICCTAAAFADGSKSGGNIPSAEPTEGTSIIITGDDEFTTALIESGDVASALPEDVKAEIEGLDSFDEVVTVAVTGLDPETGATEDLTTKITFDTPYEAGTELKLLVHVGDKWIVLPAEADENGDITVTFPADMLDQIGAAGTATVVVASANGRAIFITEDNEFTASLKESGDVLAVLPDEVKAAIEGLTNFNEINTIAETGFTPEDTVDTVAKFDFATDYEADAKIVLLVYVNNTWTVLDAAVEENGEVSATFPADVIIAMIDEGTATMVAASDK